MSTQLNNLTTQQQIAYYTILSHAKVEATYVTNWAGDSESSNLTQLELTTHTLNKQILEFILSLPEDDFDFTFTPTADYYESAGISTNVSSVIIPKNI